MTFVVPTIVEVLMKKIALWINIRANDWIAERAIMIIASDDLNELIKLFFPVGVCSWKHWIEEEGFQAAGWSCYGRRCIEQLLQCNPLLKIYRKPET